ncbi:MAG: hypothetical protein ACO1OB_33600 [Archangium sp.]
MIGEDREPIDESWGAALTEELQALSNWFKTSWREGDALLLATAG